MSLQIVKLNLSFHDLIWKIYNVHKVVCKSSFSEHSSGLNPQGCVLLELVKVMKALYLKDLCLIKPHVSCLNLNPDY